MYRTREELLERIAVIFEDAREDPEEGWNESDIADNLWMMLIEEDGIMSLCDTCETLSRAHLDECPWLEYHRCEECGDYEDDCGCEDDEPTPVEQLEIDTAPSTQVCVGCSHMLNDCVCPKVTAG